MTLNDPWVHAQLFITYTLLIIGQKKATYKKWLKGFTITPKKLGQ
jgi:hypothetical protein